MTDVKTCTTCKETKTLNQFYTRRYPTNIGYRSECKGCHNGRTMKNYFKDKSIHIKASHRYKLKLYGVDESWYNSTLEKQGGCCAVCGVKNPELSRKGANYFSIDHCHETGKVRGLLCSKCNAGIGMLGDNLEGVTNAYKYLGGRY